MEDRIDQRRNPNSKFSRIALGTWAIGGWMWGGTDEKASIATIEWAVARGITLIDTAPVYGFGRSEEIVGKALADGRLRAQVQIATKVGLDWRDGKVFRNASRARILKEIGDCLRRLRTDSSISTRCIGRIRRADRGDGGRDARALRSGRIGAIGVSNFSVEQMERFRRVAPLHSVQPPYNLFERGIEADLLPYCREHGIAVLGYGALCRGLLAGKIGAAHAFCRRRPPPERSQVPAAAARAVSRRGRASRSLRAAALRQARHPSRGALDARPGRDGGALGRAAARSARPGG